VRTTSDTTAMVPKDDSAAFFRLSDQATNPVTLFTVSMSGPAEVPPVTSDATGFGIMSLQGTDLAYQIEFSGLSGPAQASHIHGPANTTNAAGVLIPLQFTPAAAGVLSGVVGVTSDQLTLLKSGTAYVNIHTAANGGGEIRGQIAPTQFTATLSGPNEVPAVASSGTGSATLTLIDNQLFWDVTYSGLTSSAIAAHVHGPGSPTQAVGVLFPIGNPTGTSGTLTGTQTLTMQQFGYLLDGLTYINVHTTANSGGEIRGQIVPQ
jgi:CHRD domain